MSQATFEISGMSCGHCVKAVDKALSQAEGVIDRQVAIGSATVDFDAARIDIATIAQVIDDAGYPVTATR
ncbi:heavy-metal-associated domain-containing protein [Gemmatimonas sp.]|jgi:copper chaperone|uniref:heavy-metal-associated domain-containing protein n=1 Tax=Gemmatimonas sp. TaxID=1962908 RepID=UPI0037BF5FF8